MSPPSPPEHRALFFLRRGDGRVSGPHAQAVIEQMLAAGELTGAEHVAIDRRSWKPLAMLVGPLPQAPAAPAPAAPPPASTAATGGRAAYVELPTGLDLEPSPSEDRESGLAAAGPPGIATLAPEAPGDLSLETAMASHRQAAPAGGIAVAARSAGPGAAKPNADLDLGDLPSLELVERKPARPPPAAAGVAPRGVAEPVPAPPVPGPTVPRAALRPAPPPTPGDLSAVPVPVSLSASSHAVLSPDDAATAELHEPDPTRPVSLGPATEPKKSVRPRTITAARAGNPLTSASPAPPRWRRLALPGAILIALGGAVAVALALDLPTRLRPEPAVGKVLGPLAAEVAQDRFPAYGQAARLLEEAVAARRQAPRVRAQAALLLASSVVIHGGERGRLAQADALLPEPGAKPDPSVTLAHAWLALGKSRWKEAQAAVEDGAVPLAAGDRATLRGWLALGRQDAAAAQAAFVEAIAATPPPSPSLTAARYGLALAREANLSPEALAAYRAVLAEAPAHVGAALGLLRLSSLAPAARLKLAQTLIATRGADASRAELAEAHARAGDALAAMGDLVGAEAARLRARQADPSCAALAIARGDRALREGRRDEALDDYKVTLTAPPATPRTPAFHFARVGALLAGGRAQDAGKLLARLEQGLPADPRPPYWRGQLAEHGPTPDLTAAEHQYEDALKRDPAFVPASLDLARLRLGQHRTAEALGVLKRAEGQGATPVALRIALGEALLASGNPTEAVRVFRQAVADDPQNPAARLGFASALYGTGDAAAAAAEVTALATRPDSATLGKRLGDALGDRIGEMLVKLGRREEALAFYRKEIASGSATPDTKVAAARLALERGDRDEAQKLAEAAAAEDPRTPGALFVVGQVLRARGDLAGALSELRRAQAVDASPALQLEVGRVLSALGRDEEAMAALGNTGDLPSDVSSGLPEASVERGRIALRRGNADKAVDELTAATARLPGNAEAFLLLGQAEDRLGHADKAEAAFKTTARLLPTSGEAHYRLGRLLLDRGAVAASLPHLRSATERAPVTAPWRADAYFQLGFAEQRQGNRERSVAAFRRYLELAPSDAPARGEVEKQLGGPPR